MSSDLQSALEAQQMNNYACFALLTTVLYDYVLTFSSEVHYIWVRKQQLSSKVKVHYSPIAQVLDLGLHIVCPGGSTFIPGPVRVSTATYLLSDWTFPIFLSAADLVMILRVYAMWNQSKWILWVLLFIYVPTVIFSFVFVGIYNDPNTYLSVTVVQVLDFSVCSASFNGPSTLYLYTTIPGVTLGVALFNLALFKTLKQSVQMYRATKQWQPNKYMQLLLREGFFYFFVYTLTTITTYLSQNDLGLTLFPMMPRFIISVRELYDHNLHACWQGVDTGFGIFSQPTASISFAEVVTERGQGQEGDVEAIRMEELRNSTHQVVKSGDVCGAEAIRLEVLGGGTHQV
ncbi:hypothetical protein HD554DRAFT_2327130 [Boletus coccyginus]|nr:hypothetical protein HD554DRAFT_2327130 [Boletus coccyginus]